MTLGLANKVGQSKVVPVPSLGFRRSLHFWSFPWDLTSAKKSLASHMVDERHVSLTIANRPSSARHAGETILDQPGPADPPVDFGFMRQPNQDQPSLAQIRTTQWTYGFVKNNKGLLLQLTEFGSVCYVARAN